MTFDLPPRKELENGKLSPDLKIQFPKVFEIKTLIIQILCFESIAYFTQVFRNSRMTHFSK